MKFKLNDKKIKNIEKFEKNPVIFWNHNYDQEPIGKITKIKRQEDSIDIEVEIKIGKYRELVKNGVIIDPGIDGTGDLIEISFIPNYKKRK